MGEKGGRKEEGRRKKEEGGRRREKGEGRREEGGRRKEEGGRRKEEEELTRRRKGTKEEGELTRRRRTGGPRSAVRGYTEKHGGRPVSKRRGFLIDFSVFYAKLTLCMPR